MSFAALFPGQGSQHTGMAKSFFDNFTSVQRLFEEASDITGLHFKKLCFDGPEADLTQTQNTQPALLLSSYAAWLSGQEVIGFKNAQLYLGHSLGEYTACVAAHIIPFSEAIKAVHLRGQFMQEAVPVGEGAMAAVIGLDETEVLKLCQWAMKATGASPIEPANFNCPGQVVVSGKKTLIDFVAKEFNVEKVLGEQKRVRIIPLKVSAPFHCSLMKPAQEKMEEVLRDLTILQSQAPLIQNFDGLPHQAPDEIRNNLITQISGAVRWTQSITTAEKSGLKRYVEWGPGQVLSGLVKKIDSQAITFNIQNTEDLKNLEKDMKQWVD